MSERLDERLRRAARTYRRLGNHTAEGMFLEAADTICELQTENAKLRELVLTLYMCSNIRCGRCKYGHGNTCDFDAENELRELGVEVDDGQQ